MAANYTQEELVRINKDRHIHQICVLSNDIYKTMEQWVNTLKIGPWRLMDFNDKTMHHLIVDGKPVTDPYRFLIATCTWGNIEFEIVQPVYGPQIYREYLDRKGEGFHHFKEYVSDENWEATLSEYESRGLKVMQTGQFHTDKHAYIQVEPNLNFILELGNCPPIELREDEFDMYPAE